MTPKPDERAAFEAALLSYDNACDESSFREVTTKRAAVLAIFERILAERYAARREAAAAGVNPQLVRELKAERDGFRMLAADRDSLAADNERLRSELQKVIDSAPEIHGDGMKPERSWGLSYPLDSARAALAATEGAK